MSSAVKTALLVLLATLVGFAATLMLRGNAKLVVFCLDSFGEDLPGPEPRPFDWWQAMHQKLKAEVEAADEEGQEGFGMLLYGDSITESWRGTDGGGDCPRCSGAPEVLDRHFGKYHPGVLGVGGDRSANLWWRLLNGEMPRVHHPRAAVLLIGTNDIGKAWEDTDWDPRAEPVLMQAVPALTSRVLSILHLLRDSLPDTHVVLLGLLPRGGARDGVPAHAFHWPSVFTQPFRAVNAHLRQFADLDGHIHYLDCGDRYFEPGGRAISAALMPDALHPSAQGYELLAECMLPLVASIMQGRVRPGPRDGAVGGNATVAPISAA